MSCCLGRWTEALLCLRGVVIAATATALTAKGAKGRPAQFQKTS